jgi:replicative DNA helicase
MADGSLHLGEISEALVPAAAMYVPGFFEAGGRLPDPDDFDDAGLGALWQAILDTQKRKLNITRINLQRELREAGYDDTKAFKAIANLPDPAYVKLDEAMAACEEMLSRRLRRQAQRVCKEALNDLNTVHNVQELIERTERAMSDLAAQSDEADAWVKVSDAKEGRTERLPTGVDDLDKVNHGLPIGELTIGAGRTGMGKSAFAATIMLNVALQGVGVAAFSLEMQTQQLINRMSAAEAYNGGRLSSGRSPNPQYDDYERGVMGQEELSRFFAAREAVKRMPMRIDDRRGRTLNQVRLGARRAKMLFEREGVEMKLLVVDHLGKIRPDKHTGNRHLDLGDITEGLAEIASELQVSVFALAQLSRGVESRDDKRPMLHDLRESGRIEEDAHTIWLFYRPAYYDERAKDRGDEPEADEQKRIGRERWSFEVDFAKNRGGRIQRVPLFCDIGCNAFLSKDDKRVPLLATGGALP